MEILQNKIDFALVIAVHHANPNGDPLNGNRPRETYEGYGEISDVCLKRKIRNRLMDLGASVLSSRMTVETMGSTVSRSEPMPARLCRRPPRPRIGKRMPRRPARHGWMCAALDRCLLLKTMRFRWGSADLCPSTRHSVWTQSRLTACKSPRASTA